MFSTIAEGNADTADLFFLIAIVLAVIAAVGYASTDWLRLAPSLLCAAVACLALAWLVL